MSSLLYQKQTVCSNELEGKTPAVGGLESASKTSNVEIGKHCLRRIGLLVRDGVDSGVVCTSAEEGLTKTGDEKQARHDTPLTAASCRGR